MDTPDRWDENPVDEAANLLAAQRLDGQPQPAVMMPGQNVFAKEFVPCFGPKITQPDAAATLPSVATISKNDQPPLQTNVPLEIAASVNPANTLPLANNSNIESGSHNGIEKEEEDGGTWSDKASEAESTADEGSVDVDAELGASAAPKPKKKATVANAQAKRKDHLNVIFIGHVDAGKSTIGGHIMFLTGQVDKRTLEKYEKEAKEKNRESWYLSWALDTSQEERDKGKTVEVGRGFFETDSKHFTILDAPGHKGFVPNMIGGASQADVAVLVISARKGEFETGFERGGQTREHAMLIKTAGVRHLIVVVNKMDDSTVEWGEGRFNEIKDKLTPYLKKCGFNPKTDIFYIPVSGFMGSNLKEVDREICPWYDGPALIQYLDSMAPISRMSEGAVRLPIVDKFKDMGTIVFGKLESGSIKKGQVLTLMPNKAQVEVMQLWSDDDETESVMPGENVKVKLKNIEEEDVTAGFILCSPDNLCHTARIFDAKVVILEHKSIICAGYQSRMHIHTCAEDVVVRALICLIDKKTDEKSSVRPRYIKQDQVAIIRLEVVGGMICLEAFENFPQLGRFTLRDESRTIGIGKVVKVVK